MANTYTQIYLQLVFSPLGRENIIPQKHKEELQKYTTGIIQNRKHKLLTINYMPDHVHIFIGYQPAQSLPELMRDIDSVIKYIDNQEVHHRKATFKDEYLRLLEKFDILYDKRYLFEWYD